MAFAVRHVPSLDRVYFVPQTRADRFVSAHLSNPEAYTRLASMIFDETGERLSVDLRMLIAYMTRAEASVRGVMFFDQPRYYLYVDFSTWDGRGLPTPPVSVPPDPITPNEDPERPRGD